jgi:hypothetical protein
MGIRSGVPVRSKAPDRGAGHAEAEAARENAGIGRVRGPVLTAIEARSAVWLLAVRIAGVFAGERDTDSERELPAIS